MLGRAKFVRSIQTDLAEGSVPTPLNWPCHLRHVGTDDRGCTFDRRPHGDSVVVPGRICRMAPFNQGLQSDYAADDRECSHREGCQDTYLPWP